MSKVTPSAPSSARSTTSSRAELFRASTTSIQQSLKNDNDNQDGPEPVIPQPKVFPNNKPPKYLKEEESPTKLKAKIFLRFFFRKFGMLIGTIIYCMGGAYLFNILEAQNELAGCEGSKSDSAALINDYTLKIFNYMTFNVTYNPILAAYTADNSTEIKDGPEVYNGILHDWLVELRDEVIGNGYGGEDCEVVNSWQFLSGLLWTMTVVTSIGYGHTSPTTWEGQIVLFCYALLGMPLFLMTCAEISNALADFYILIYKHFFCCACNIYSNYKINHADDDEEEIMEEDCVESPDDLMYQPAEAKASYDDDGNSIAASILDAPEEEKPEEEAVRVPFVIIIGTLIGFLISGGYLFKLLEDWDVILGVYFTYISISSVGFGDYSPGTAFMAEGDLVRASRNLIIGTIFIVTGMSILGMCFSLMLDGIVDNMTMLFTKLGIIKEESDNEDEEEEICVDMVEDRDTDGSESNDDETKTKVNRSNEIEYLKSEPQAGAEFNMHRGVNDDDMSPVGTSKQFC